ncbi:MAG: hypothetical protein NTX25_19630 [Proteobacteria bacterium]|nr:hypothetical protein [Pseudomonadota bacterium]
MEAWYQAVAKGDFMGQVIELAKFRTSKKRSYLKKYESHISKFVKQFVSRNIRYSFESISQYYIAQKQKEEALAWDYIDMRETVKEALVEVFGEQMWVECQELYWFDARYLSKDDLLEYCISEMVLGEVASAQR